MLIALAVALLVSVGALAFRRTRWGRPARVVGVLAYLAYAALGLAYFPMRGGAGLTAPVCEWTFGPALAIHSLTNVNHIVLFVFFFFLTYANLSWVRHPFATSLAACLAMGFLVEIAQGASGEGHCRMRDLIPDAAGALAAAAITGFIRRTRAGRSAGTS